MGKHERKDTQTGDGSDQDQPEPKDSGRPGKHRKVVIDLNDAVKWKPVIG